jgi:DNA (cytosine-5)-methyltransferase 1
MKVFSMFSGIGGFDLAMRNLGHEIIGACEIDKYARKVYARQFPGVPIHNDATRLQAESLPQFDVLCAGFPCQAFSIAGKRRGFEDTRGSLFFEIARIAKEKKPSLLLLENVKGLLSHDKGETFRTIISTLDEMGYDAEWQVLNSKYHVPQNRERIFIVGHLRGQRARQVFPLGDFNQKTDRKIKKAGQLTSHNGTSFYDISGISPTLISSEGSGSIVKIKHHINATSQADRVYDTDGIGPTLGIGNAMSKPLIGVINDKGTFKEVDKSTCIDANYHKGMDNHGQRTMVKAVLTPDRLEKEDGEPAFTLNTQDRHGVYDGIKIRKLTPKECERLQGFPDDWTKYDDDGNIVSDTQRYKMCGNAVTVPVVQYIASHFEFPS